MITLYHAPQSRSGSIVWLLDELKVPYETKIVGIRRADGSGARDQGNPHPHGKVPAIKDGADVIFETGAIALYLTDKYPQADLGPVPGQPDRGHYVSWMAYRSGVLEPAILCKRFGVNHVYGAMGWAPAEEVEQVLNAHLAERPYFLGEKFSAADIVVGGGLHFLMMAKMLQETPVLKAYCARITDRAAFKSMMARDQR
jgi:glutathione S-transferase